LSVRELTLGSETEKFHSLIFNHASRHFTDYDVMLSALRCGHILSKKPAVTLISSNKLDGAWQME
jgi:hypothetical protein